VTPGPPTHIFPTAERSHPTAKTCALQANRNDPGVLDRSDGATAVGAMRRAIPLVAPRLVALAARDPRLFYRPLRGR